MLTDLASKRLPLAIAALAALTAAASIAGSARADNPPPVVTVGPISDPQSNTTASGSAGSGGQADACVNGDHSGASPSTTDPTGAASVNDSSCQKNNAATGTAGAGAAGSNSRTVSSSTGAAQTASVATGSTASRRARAATVAAANARGIQITRIKYLSATPTKKQLRLIVTIRDIDRRLIRGAIVTVRPLPNTRHTITATLAGFSSAVGQATLTVPVTRQMLGVRLQFVVSARTPTSHALKIGSIHLPGVKTRSMAGRT